MLSLRRTFAATLTFGSILVAAGPAQALSIQSVSAGSFTTTGTTTNTAPLTFSPFTAGPPSTLSGVKLRIVSGSFSQQLTLQKTNTGSSSRTVTVSGLPTFNFGTTPTIFSPTTAQLITTSVDGTPTSTVTGTGPQSLITTASGNWVNPFTAISTNTPALRNYFSGTPSITTYATAYNQVSCLNGSASASNCGFQVNDDPTDSFMISTQFSGTLFVDYEYELPPAATPGPLPVVGAGVAFAASRRLRRRIKLNKSVS